MSRLIVSSFGISIDGFSAGPEQSLDNPLGIGGPALMEWAFTTRTFQAMHGGGGGEAGVDDDFAARGFANVGAWILGRNMFGPIRGAWPDDEWKGWWGANPPYHVPVFVLTHHPRESIVMEGGTVFHFVTDGIHAALARAREAAQGRDVRVGGGVATVRQYLLAGLVDELHLAQSPALLGAGEALFTGIDLHALGFACSERVVSPHATHVVLTKGAASAPRAPGAPAFPARSQEPPMISTLQPAAELAAAVSKPYPNDSAAYRAARTALLADEIELRRQIERVAEQRRALPLGGEPPAYAFKDENGKTLALADLFGQHDTLVTYFWMYGPQRKSACPMCTAFLGSMDTPVRDISQRVAFAVLGRSPVERQLAFARERGWRNLKFFMTVGDDFARDYRCLSPEGDEWPALDVWVKRDGKVHHFWASELGGTQDPGQDPRGAPDPTPLWNILDLTPAGRGADWYPKLSYPTEA